MDELVKRLEKLEYYQKLLAEMVSKDRYPFYCLIIEHGLTKQEVESFYQLCDRLNKKRKEQKAEEFVYYTPLFKEFQLNIPVKLNVVEVIESCLKQKIYTNLMLQLKKNL
ncbi:DUF1878 family protein [Bacillus seohaeanensis]|jgi:hypothetical protein|uniref:DUF1878 family protein n=1 Tax=Bacillus seohaeanensis TaxID=284580 RepID=A0ABW5RQT4_9BACI